MAGPSLTQRFWFAVDDVGRALRYPFRPWIELRAVKQTQVDIVNAVSACQADLAETLASLKTFSEALERLEARSREHDTAIHRLTEAGGSATDGESATLELEPKLGRAE